MAADGHTQTQERLLDAEALAASVRRMVPGWDRPVIDPNAFSEARAVLAAEISRLTGADEAAAGRAAGAFLNDPVNPIAQFNDWSTGKYAEAVAGASALARWLEARGAAAPVPSFPRLALKAEPGERYEGAR